MLCRRLRRGSKKEVPVTEYVSSVSGLASSMVMPTHQIGDLIIALDLRSSSLPTLATGWTSINTSTTPVFTRLYYKVATSTSETFTGSDATRRAAAVYRSSGDISVGAHSAQTGTSATYTYPSLSLNLPPGWVITLLANDGGFGTGTGTPAGTVSRTVYNASGANLVICDTNEDVSSWSSTDVVTASGSDWAAYVVEITP